MMPTTWSGVDFGFGFWFYCCRFVMFYGWDRVGTGTVCEIETGSGSGVRVGHVMHTSYVL